MIAKQNTKINVIFYFYNIANTTKCRRLTIITINTHRTQAMVTFTSSLDFPSVSGRTADTAAVLHNQGPLAQCLGLWDIQGELQLLQGLGQEGSCRADQIDHHSSC
jgi:hypothetical protein